MDWGKSGHVHMFKQLRYQQRCDLFTSSLTWIFSCTPVIVIFIKNILAVPLDPKQYISFHFVPCLATCGNDELTLDITIISYRIVVQHFILSEMKNGCPYFLAVGTEFKCVMCFSERCIGSSYRYPVKYKHLVSVKFYQILEALSYGAIFLATCNSILLLEDIN